MPNCDPCQIITPLVLVGLGLGVGEGLWLGVGLGLGNQIAISTRGVIIWQGVENGHNTGTVTSYWWAAKQRQNAITHFERSKQSERAVTGVIRCSALVSPGLFEVTVKTTHYFLGKTTKLTRDTYAHDKGCLECPKNINNSFSTNNRSYSLLPLHGRGVDKNGC